jgi:hypothetical protein
MMTFAIIVVVSFLIFGRAFTAYALVAALTLSVGGVIYVLGWNPGHEIVHAPSPAPKICMMPDKNRHPEWQVYPPCYSSSSSPLSFQ